MISWVSFILVLITLSVIRSNPVEQVEIEEDLVDGLVKAIPITIIYDRNLPAIAEKELLEVIQGVHNNYVSHKLRAEAVSGRFTYRNYYCAWNVVIYPKNTTLLDGAIWCAVPKSGYALVLVDDTVFYNVCSSPQQSRRCEF